MSITPLTTRQRRHNATQPLGDYLSDWIDTRQWLRASTRACYRLHIDKHLTPKLGTIPLNQLTPVEVERFAFDLLAKGTNPATVERILATLSSAYTTATMRDLVPRNPVSAVRIPRQSPRQLPRWNVEHAQTFLDGLGTDHLDVLFRVALITGMRRGELLGLLWSDVDLSEGVLSVCRSRLQVGPDTFDDATKSKHSNRKIYLDPTTVNRLKMLAHRLGVMDPHRHLFTDPHGQALNPGWVSYRFARRIEQMGLPKIRFHDLRHASATFGLATGESLKEVSQRLGHSDITVTANIYVDVLPETAKASARRLAAALSSPVRQGVQLRSA